ncbi:MAG: hypothetical protein PHU61_03390 [Candidatus Absconditabacteria bacterium]|nr:hypothetical protein [Candidatus Absconditabacteria bacterium]MDD3868308.1 hypothetical protein [Candidatus Absconditabacteria bacterium]MDD4714002.1 hypothetical protein [Candidatus Absconditabacteria bacterium]
MPIVGGVGGFVIQETFKTNFVAGLARYGKIMQFLYELPIPLWVTGAVLGLVLGALLYLVLKPRFNREYPG